MFLIFCLLPVVAALPAVSFFDASQFPLNRPVKPSGKTVDITLANLLDPNDKFTIQDLEYYLKIFSDYPDYVPEPVKTIFNNLPQDIKKEIVSTVNDIETGKIVVPNNEAEIIKFVQSKCPQFYKRVEAAIDQLMDIVGELSDQTKAKFNKWWKKGFAAASGDNEGRANRLAKFISDFYYAFSKTDSFTKQDVAKASPEAYRLLTSDFAGQFAKAAKRFAAAGLTGDIHKLGAKAKAPAGYKGNRQATDEESGLLTEGQVAGDEDLGDDTF